MAGACFLGWFASGYLLYTYVTGAPMSCALVSGCEQVRASKWAYVYGIPRPILGVVFYSALFGLLVIRSIGRSYSRLLYRLMIGMICFAFLETLMLLHVQWFELKAFCFWCLWSTFASSVLFIMMWFDRPVSTEEAVVGHELKHLFYSLILFLPAAVGGFVWLLYAS